MEYEIKPIEQRKPSIDTRSRKKHDARYRTAWILVILCAFYFVMTGIWVMWEPPVVLTVMEILTIVCAVVVLFFFILLYYQVEDGRKSIGTFSLILTSGMAVLTIANHMIYMTVITPLYKTLKDTPMYFRLDGWPSVTKAVECVAWALLLGLAMVSMAYALRREEKVTKMILSVSGVMVLAGLSGPICQNMLLYFFSTAGYTVGFLVLALHDIVVGK